eukprot:TsM_001025600 transcript=TsM_001025600 gene=TsM_001025600
MLKTLIYPKENIAKTYTKFVQKHLGYDFDHHTVMHHFTEVYGHVGNKWPNFGRFDGVSAECWWNEILKFIQTFTRSSPFSEAYVRRALTMSVTNEIYDWFSSNEAWDLVPGSITGLSKLTDAGIKLAILSNSDERTPAILKALDLNKYFTFVVFSRSCAHMKPEPGIFKLVCSRFFGSEVYAETIMQSQMAQYSHVGDSETRDYWGALHAGCGRAFLLQPENAKTCFWAYQDDTSGQFQNLIPTRDRISCLAQIPERL